jgi:hypothetical protein
MGRSLGKTIKSKAKKAENFFTHHIFGKIPGAGPQVKIVNQTSSIGSVVLQVFGQE